MDTTSVDPIADVMIAVTTASTAVGDDPRLAQILAEVLASVDAGDHDKASRDLREFLHSVCCTAAASQADVLTGPVVDDAAQILVESLIRRRGRRCAADHDDRTRGRAPSGFEFVNRKAGPA